MSPSSACGAFKKKTQKNQSIIRSSQFLHRTGLDDIRGLQSQCMSLWKPGTQLPLLR